MPVKRGNRFEAPASHANVTRSRFIDCYRVPGRSAGTGVQARIVSQPVGCVQFRQNEGKCLERIKRALLLRRTDKESTESLVLAFVIVGPS